MFFTHALVKNVKCLVYLFDKINYGQVVGGSEHQIINENDGVLGLKFKSLMVQNLPSRRNHVITEKTYTFDLVPDFLRHEITMDDPIGAVINTPVVEEPKNKPNKHMHHYVQYADPPRVK